MDHTLEFGVWLVQEPMAKYILAMAVVVLWGKACYWKNKQ